MTTLTHAINIASAPDSVIAALTTPDGLRSWHAPSVTGDPRPGGTVTLSYEHHPNFTWRVTGGGDVDDPLRWECLDGPETAPGTTITYTLSTTHDGRTRVTCVHNGLPDDPLDVAATCNTLLGMMLGRLRDYVANGIAEPAFR